VETPKRNRPLGRPRHRWKDSTKTDLKEIGWQGVDWTDVAQDSDKWWAFVNKVMNFCVP
jgi:hypothetical protein